MTNKYKFSKLISRIFDAPVAIIIIFYTIWSKAPQNQVIPNIYFLFAIFYLIVIPILIILLLIQIDVIDNWELTDRKTRKYAYIIGFIVLVITSFLSNLFNIPEYFINYLYLALSIVIVYGFITNFTNIKISLHISTWTGVILFLGSYISLFYLLFSPLIVLIGYARYTIKNHSLLDMFAGYYLTLIILVGFIVLSNLNV